MKKIMILLALVSAATTVSAQKILSWKEAPIAASVDVSYNALADDAFSNFDGWVGLGVDLQYKNLYTGIVMSPQQKITSGGLKASSGFLTFGATLPLEVGKSVLSICPMVVVGGNVTSYYSQHNWDGYFSIGPGIKFSYIIANKVNVGVRYTHLFCTPDNSPDGWFSVGGSVGYVF